LYKPCNLTPKLYGWRLNKSMRYTWIHAINVYWFSLKLVITDPVSQVLNESKIQPLKGQALKTNEDALDAIVCTAGGSINQ
jgi:hypothetical protein